YTALLLISWIGANLIVVGSMTTGELMSMFMYVMQILVALNMMSMVFVILIISRPSAERMIEVLDEKSDLTDPLNPTETIADGSISFENVDFSYTNDPDKLVLKDLNFSIQSGQTVGIIG